MRPAIIRCHHPACSGACSCWRSRSGLRCMWFCMCACRMGGSEYWCQYKSCCKDQQSGENDDPANHVLKHLCLPFLLQRPAPTSPDETLLPQRWAGRYNVSRCNSGGNALICSHALRLYACQEETQDLASLERQDKKWAHANSDYGFYLARLRYSPKIASLCFLQSVCCALASSVSLPLHYVRSAPPERLHPASQWSPYHYAASLHLLRSSSRRKEER